MKSLICLMVLSTSAFGATQTIDCKAIGKKPEISKMQLKIDSKENKVSGSLTYTKHSSQDEGDYSIGSDPKDKIQYSKDSLQIHGKNDRIVFDLSYTDLYTYVFTLSRTDAEGGYVLALTKLSDTDPQVHQFECQDPM